ncbi:MurR/RpiR family transcriptional regulator [Spiroplasma culicicola]|uniref:HTH rpiR-type domain-containing protein n=1 Tax=Spiroplasma culicicola AES-1 TaxID=1276246 RepID=W6A7S3_9MOLU|nr:hypothetical protein [Spiroplasma culicicola]AHI53036.1 hypothetical protein SCULI_v1c06950 [Spiroplasma culicicola AES-1]
MISMYERIENLVKDNRNTTFKSIAKQLLDDFNQGIFKNQNELADACFVSMSTVTQFAKATLCEGYKELAIRLKIEHESMLAKQQPTKEINYNQVDDQNLNIINEWALNSSDFILKLAEQINQEKKLWIAPSFQSMYTARHFENILRNQGVDARVMDSSINLEVVRHVDYKDQLVLVIMTGRDTETLSRILEFLEKLSKRVYIIITTNHLTEVPEVEEWTKTIINYNLSSDYKYRAHALMTLFLLIAEKVENKPKIL